MKKIHSKVAVSFNIQQDVLFSSIPSQLNEWAVRAKCLEASSEIVKFRKLFPLAGDVFFRGSKGFAEVRETSLM